MKYLLVLLASISVLCRTGAQDTRVHHRIPEPVKVIALYTGSVLLNAAGDGLNDSGQKAYGHLCNAGSIGLLLMSPLMIDYNKSRWAWYLTTYVTLRISFFDYTYNMARGLPLDYIGTSNYWDRMLGNIPGGGVHIGRAGALIIGIAIPVNRFGDKRKFR